MWKFISFAKKNVPSNSRKINMDSKFSSEWICCSLASLVLCACVWTCFFFYCSVVWQYPPRNELEVSTNWFTDVKRCHSMCTVRVYTWHDNCRTCCMFFSCLILLWQRFAMSQICFISFLFFFFFFFIFSAKNSFFFLAPIFFFCCRRCHLPCSISFTLSFK